MSRSHPLQAALAEWRDLLGPDRVDEGAGADRRYGATTAGLTAGLAAALRPESEKQVPGLVAIADRHGIPLYPVSTGRNWGYGNAVPPSADCVLVDLSRLDRILDLDTELGLVTVQPGVTQAQLDAFLTEQGANLMVPVHGGGPHCSILGNALERGYGITPYTDHFGALTALEAILPDGSRYRSALTELGADRADRAHKWGLGPYLDGLFAQGAFGIVTRATFALAPRPEARVLFHFRVDTDAGLEAAVRGIRRLTGDLEGILGGVNLMNGRRVLAMTEPYPEGVPPGEIMDPEAVRARLRPYGVGAWTGVGALYGPRALVRAGRRHVRRTLGEAGFRPGFWDRKRVAGARALLRRVPARWSAGPGRRLEKLAQTLDLLDGHPSGVALPLACWRTDHDLPAGPDLDPARAGCGLIWHAPLVPLTPADARRFVDLVEGTCAEHGIEPLITLTTLSPRCFDSTIPLLFDPAEPGATERARRCQRALLTRGRQEGFLPYRLDAGAMAEVVDPDLPFWATAGRLKAAVDPRGILSPGRYTPGPSPD